VYLIGFSIDEAPAGAPSDMQDIKYWTPEPTPEPTQVPEIRRIATNDCPQLEQRSKQQKFYLDEHRTMGLPMVNVQILLGKAMQTANGGDLGAADALFRDAIAGFRELTCATDWSTVKAAYHYACFHVRNGNLDKADAVLDWMTEKYEKRWGKQDDNTYVHYGRVARLLWLWDRKELHEDLIDEILNGLDHCKEPDQLSQIDDSGTQVLHPTRIASSMTRPCEEADLALANNRPISFDTVDVCMTDLTNLDDVLAYIIVFYEDSGYEAHCRNVCRASYIRVRRRPLQADLDIDPQATQILHRHAQPSLTRLLECRSGLIPLNSIEVALEVAITFFDAKDKASCSNLVNQVTNALFETQKSCPSPEPEASETRKHALMKLFLSTAMRFHERGSSQRCRFFLKRALDILG
jgi:hypothetical protein